ncbi:FAD/NAD(P)-binding domain-containing protein [Exidia glandulosa HHB12029]|uniref:FAD/NAD(P)-binding domain-containing protein n=1 Tax=Exidia glandulosa HHB12029 TaxID=1314781 RepID=A0A165GK79_EXIGL|nr:FAD/NAD(P)-binding domain-containing protein [Exidia glandulosa HHB12029]
MCSVPTKTTVLVIGGGPAGSYAASVLARHNIEVTVLEAAKFPRYHIGESLLASTNYFLEFIDARKTIIEHGFVRKPGGAFKLRKDFPEAYTDFVDHSTGNHALNVIRAEYDDLLFRHAGLQGARVFDGHKVTSIEFASAEPARPLAAQWTDLEGHSGTIAFDYVIDASGRPGLLSTKYHRDRKMTESLRNTAIWAYWTGATLYGTGTEREGAPLIEALHDHSGWCWYIPVSDGTMSIGFVLHENVIKVKKAGKTLEDMYLSFFEQLSDVNKLKDGAIIAPNKSGSGCPVYMASDYSYCASDVGKINYRLVGDAACFIDPFFSSGVHLAFVGALSAALSIIAIIDGHASENESADFYSTELKTAYTRFFVVVASGYKQMRGRDVEDVNVLNDVDEKSFDRAFHRLRPVIQGLGDIGQDSASGGNASLSEKELQHSMDFVFKLFVEPGDTVNRDYPGNMDSDVQERLLAMTGPATECPGLAGVKDILDGVQERMRRLVLDTK